MDRERTPRTFGIKLIIAYKFVKAPLMFALAVWLTFDQKAAYAFGQHVAHGFADAGLVRLASWLHRHLTARVLERGAVVAWLDGSSTAIEGFLLWLGKSWGEWIVTVGMGALLPFEAIALAHKPSPERAAVLVINAAIVAYLVYRRIQSAPRAHGRARPSASV